MKYIILLLLTTIAHAEPYDWRKSKFINPIKMEEPKERFITKKNPYGKGQRTESNFGRVWITEPNPYNKKELRTIRIH